MKGLLIASQNLYQETSLLFQSLVLFCQEEQYLEKEEKLFKDLKDLQQDSSPYKDKFEKFAEVKSLLKASKNALNKASERKKAALVLKEQTGILCKNLLQFIEKIEKETEKEWTLKEELRAYHQELEKYKSQFKNLNRETQRRKNQLPQIAKRLNFYNETFDDFLDEIAISEDDKFSEKDLPDETPLEEDNVERSSDEQKESVEQKVYTGFSDMMDPEEALNPHHSLQTNHSYYFWLEVSEEAIKNAIDATPTVLPTQLIPDAKQLKVAIFTLADHFLLSPTADIGFLKIDNTRQVSVLKQAISDFSSSISNKTAKKRLFFPVQTLNREGTYVLLCNIYYENILVQSRHIRAEVKKIATPRRHALLTEMQYSLTRTLSAADLAKHKRHRLSILLQEDDQSHSFQFFGGKNLKNAASFDAGELEHQLERLRAGLRLVAWGKETEWNKDPYNYVNHVSVEKFTSDLGIIAIRGYQFYDTVVGKLSGGAVEELEEAMKKPGYIQVALQGGARHVLPLALLYDQPLDTSFLPHELQLCSTFEAAINNKTPLTETACFQGNCPTWEDDETICPSGFWGFRHYIGLPHTSQQNTTAPSEIFYEDNPELVVSVYAGQDFKMRDKHIQNLSQHFKEEKFIFKDSRNDTLRAFKNHQPHLVYFYCHGAFTGSNNPVLLVGDKNDRPISRDNLRAKRIKWDESHPLVFINGCHTAALRPSLAMDFVSAFVETSEAAGVIGTEITIFEPLATAFAEAFFERFLNGESVGKAIRDSRLALLQGGNPLGLVYVPYVISSLQLAKRNTVL